MENRELEVKIIGIDLEELKKRILKLGGYFKSKEVQKNIQFSSKNNPIKDDEQLRIRISKYDNGEIKKEFTFKKILSNEGLRDNIEININIDREDNLIKILGYMGYQVMNVAFKDRSTYIFEGSRIDFDQWDKDTYPFPYCEIEVSSKDDLDSLVKKLDIDEKYISTASIRDLIKDYRKKKN